MFPMSSIKVVICILMATVLSNSVLACRVESEKLKSHARSFVEFLLDPEELESIYWPEEPLDARALSNALSMNVSLAETKFLVATKTKKSIIQDMFVTCATDRNRKYMITLNLELENPFKNVDLEVERWDEKIQQIEHAKIRFKLNKSTFLVQLNQLISYDQCLEVNYVQLSPTMNYEIQCDGCNEDMSSYLDRIFTKRMTQLDGELDTLLSEKLLLGIQKILSQKRLDLDLYMK